MKSRWILYGYKVVNGKFYIEESEAGIVREIFQRYLNSESLSQISKSLTEREIPYYEDKKTWNKSMVSRILGNQHYSGDIEYPLIISKMDFEKATSFKKSKTGNKHIDTPETIFLKKHMFCKCCGKSMRRLSKWGTREKWMCSAGCKPTEYIDDEWIEYEINKMISKIKANPEIARSNSKGSGYIPNLNVTRTVNEIRRLQDQSKIDFNAGVKAVFGCASAKFDCCHIDNSKAISDELIERIISTSKVSIDFYENVISRISVEPSGIFEIQLTNNTILYNSERMEEDARKKDDNEN